MKPSVQPVRVKASLGQAAQGDGGSGQGKWVQSLGFLVQPALLLLPDWSSLLGVGVKWERL